MFRLASSLVITAVGGGTAVIPFLTGTSSFAVLTAAEIGCQRVFVGVAETVRPAAASFAVH